MEWRVQVAGLSAEPPTCTYRVNNEVVDDREEPLQAE